MYHVHNNYCRIPGIYNHTSSSASTSAMLSVTVGVVVCQTDIMRFDSLWFCDRRSSSTSAMLYIPRTTVTTTRYQVIYLYVVHSIINWLLYVAKHKKSTPPRGAYTLERVCMYPTRLVFLVRGFFFFPEHHSLSLSSSTLFSKEEQSRGYYYTHTSYTCSLFVVCKDDAGGGRGIQHSQSECKNIRVRTLDLFFLRCKRRRRLYEHTAVKLIRV